ncbi:restriction endonuclease subunit S [Saccharomonospora iraqiensis]|uniref:restriction endonuclease subunit S n=1 Tax=Saccharomonospora iraqiensis TaxID=52698 RepID=UPI00022E461C|nr:restriction endonuclease subunit S [Saccharomonospora iraqiensis]
MTITVQLRRVARLAYGDSLASESRIDGEYPVVGSGGVSGTHNERNFRAPGIVIGRKGSYGSVHWIGSGGFAIDTAYYIDERMTTVDLRWLYYVLQGIDLRGASQDVGIPGLSREAAYAVHIPSPPPLEEQRRIADFLDAETARIDKVLALRDRQSEISQSRFDQIIDGVVVGDGDALAEIGIRDSSGAWSSVKLSRLCQIIPGYSFPSDGFVSEDQGIRLLRGINVSVGSLSWDEVAYWDVDRNPIPRRFHLRQGDLVLGMDRPWISKGLRLSFVDGDSLPALLLQRVACLRKISDVSMQYLRWYLCSAHFRYSVEQDLTGVSVPHISGDQIGAAMLSLPSFDVQRRIAEAVDKEKLQIDKMVALTERQVMLLSERRQALITAAVNGEFDVSAASGRGIEE